MRGSFFKFARKIGNQNLWLRDSRFWDKYIRPLWFRVKVPYNESPSAISYFSDNKNRIERIVSWLADEESKKTFLRVIKFRSYGNKKDFITHGENTQYFINDFFEWNENEVLIDCGAFDGDTLDKFISLHPKYRQIIAFEPEAKNYTKLKQKYGNNSKILAINAAVSNKNEEVFLESSGTGSKIISEPNENTISISVSTIDSLNLPYVSIIKMDIEGAEMQALKGARDTILKYKPKLAICIYHSNEDMLQIPEYIHELLPEYKLYIRHHGDKKWGYRTAVIETVLYAQVGEINDKI